MRNITAFLLEKLTLSDKTKSPNSKIEPEDPDYWEVGDVLVSCWSYSMSYNHYWCIIKKIGKATFECARVPEKIISGGGWQGEDMPDMEKYNEAKAEKQKFRVNKYGRVYEARGGGWSAMFKWDGKSSYSYDRMD